MDIELDLQMSNLRGEIAKKATVKSKLDQLEAELKTKQAEIDDFLVILEKEKRDVEQLKTFSLPSIIATIANNKVEKMKKEELEWMNAKMKHSRLVNEMNRIRDEYDICHKQYQFILSTEKRYYFLLQDKREMLLNSENAVGSEIKKQLEEIENVKNQIWETNEAIRLGQSAINSLNNAINQLSSAERIGIIDIASRRSLLGVGIAKYENINGALQSISSAKSYLNRFEKEFSDVKFGMNNINLEISTGTFIFDQFFDEFFTDLSVQRQITSSKSSIQHIKNGVEANVNKLKQLVNLLTEKNQMTNAEINKIVENYRDSTI